MERIEERKGEIEGKREEKKACILFTLETEKREEERDREENRRRK